MRIENLQQRIGDLRIFVVDPLLGSAGEERERLEEPFDVRVGAAIGFEEEPAGDGRVTLGEFLREPADEEELAFVVGEEGVVHVI